MSEPKPTQKKTSSSKDFSVNRIGQFETHAVLEHLPTRTIRILPSSEYPKFVKFGQRILPTVFQMSQSDFDKLAPPVPVPDLGFGKDIQYGVERYLASRGGNWNDSVLDANTIRGAADAAHTIVTRKIQELTNKG